MKCQAQGLRDCGDDVHGIRRGKMQNSAGSEDVQNHDEWRGNHHGARQVALGLSAFACEDRDVFESAKRAKGHFAEYAQSEDAKWRHGQVQWTELWHRALPVKQWCKDKCAQHKQSKNGTRIRDPL